MKSRLFSVLALLLVVCISSTAMAQGGGRGQGGRGQAGRGQGGFGGGFGAGGGMMQGGAMQLLQLLRTEKVPEEIQLGEEALEAITSAQQEMMGNMRGMRDMSESERDDKMKEIGTAAQDLFDEVLEPEQQKRLMGLMVQRDGFRSVTNELIAKEIGLKEEGTEKVRDAMTKAGEAMRDSFAALRPAEGERPDPAKMQEMLKESTEKMDAAIGEQLSDEQKKALEELKGEKFEFPEPTFGRGGPGGQGGGRGARGGRPGQGN